MQLFIKIVAGVAVLVLLLLGAAAIAIRTIEPRTLLAPIEAQIERATGRDVDLGGNARISLSLTPTLELDDVSLGNAAWGSEKQMIRAKRLEAQVALLPLLSRRVDIVRFTLVEPTILLETDAHGRGNWSFGESPAKPSTRSDPVTDAAGAFGLGEFEVENGDLRWRDGRSGDVTRVRIDRLHLRARDAQKPMVAQFKGAVGDVPMALEGHFGPFAALRDEQWPWPVNVEGEVAGRKTGVTTKVRSTPDGLEAGELAFRLGNASIRGTLVYAAKPERPSVRFSLASDALSMSDLAFAGGAAAATSGASVPAALKPAPRDDRRLFRDTRWPLASLRALDAQGDVAIGKLTLDDGRTLNDVRTRLALSNGRLEIPAFSANLLGGSARGSAVVDSREAPPSIAVKLDANGLDLQALMAVAGVQRDVKGGETDVDVAVNGRGASPRAFASTLNGTVTVRVGAARWVSSDSGLVPELSQLANAFNPARSAGGATDLKCAAIRLPFSGGVARFDRTIGLETDRLGAAASGTIDLRSETLELLVHPRIKDASGLDLARIAGAVKVTGSLRAPAVAFNPVGTITAATDIAALARGGRAALLGALTPGGAAGPGECAVALGAKPAPAPAAAPRGNDAQPRVDPAQEINRALGRLLRR
jgi:hypothetical protein